VTDYATSEPLLAQVERIVVASVAVTARALSDASPELTLGQWRVMVLIDRPGGMAVGAIASSLGSKIAAVSRLIGRLRERGLIQTQRASDDARVVLVSLTTSGRRLRRQIVESRRAALRAMLVDSRLTADMQPLVEQLAGALAPTE
jgi:DNA-binding MarR family transcriptional regulator